MHIFLIEVTTLPLFDITLGGVCLFEFVRFLTVFHITLSLVSLLNFSSVTLSFLLILANSLEYPERIHRGLEWTQLLKRLSVLCLIVSKFSHFSLFHPSLFIQYSTEECSTVQLLANSLEYPQRIEWSQSLNRLIVLCLRVSKFSHFLYYKVL